MTNPYEEALLECRAEVGRLEGALEAVRDQLASSLATETQLRQELDAHRIEAARLDGELAHTQRDAAARQQATAGRLEALDAELREAERSRRTAEEERAAVIAALGRRSRRALDRRPDPASAGDQAGAGAGGAATPS